MSGESGRWVSRADSRRKNRAERRVGAAPRRRAAALQTRFFQGSETSDFAVAGSYASTTSCLNHTFRVWTTTVGRTPEGQRPRHKTTSGH